MLVSKLFVKARSRHALIIFVPGYPVSRSMFEFERSHNARDEDGWEYQSISNRKENVRPEDLIQQIPNVTEPTECSYGSDIPPCWIPGG